MKWWFGRKAGRDARPFLFRWGQGGAAVAGGEWPRSYEAQVREAYLGNPVAQRAVRLVAESAARPAFIRKRVGTWRRLPRLAPRPLHRATRGHAQVRTAPGSPQPFQRKGDLSIPRSGEDF